MSTTTQKPTPPPTTAIAPKTNTAAQLMSREMTEIQSAMAIAKTYPRNFQKCLDDVAALFDRSDFADSAIYKKPQGWKSNPDGSPVFQTDAKGKVVKDKDGKPLRERNYVEGLSIDAAILLRDISGNMFTGTIVIDDTEKTRVIEVYAWDLETNNRRSEQVTVEKVMERKYIPKGQEDRKIGERTNNKGELLHLLVPSEDELRLMTSRMVSFAERNCLIKTINPILVAKADDTARARLLADAGATNQNDEERVRQISSLLAAFKKLGVVREHLETYMQKPADDWTAEDVVDLKQIGAQLKAGGQEYVTEFLAQFKEPEKPAKEKASVSRNENRGHGKDDLNKVAAEPEPAEEAEEKKEESQSNSFD